MDNFSKFVFNIQQSSFGQGVNSMFTLPTIGLPTEVAFSNAEFATKFKAVEKVMSSLGLLRGIPIYASTQKEVGENNIGQQILIRANEIGTQVITDNIAPLPRSWEITGYVGRMKHEVLQFALPKDNKKAEQFVQGVNSTIGAIDNVNTVLYLQLIKDYFRYLRILRAPFKFITREGTAVDVLMQSSTFEDEPISEYATKVTLRLTEYVALSINGTTYDVSNYPGLGSAYGISAKYATATSKSIGSSLKALLKR